MTFTCPRCGHTEQQPKHVRDVSHLCGIGKRRVKLELQPEVALTNEKE